MNADDFNLDEVFEQIEIQHPSLDKFSFDCAGGVLGILKPYHSVFLEIALELWDATDKRWQKIRDRKSELDDFSDQCEALLLREIASNQSIIALVSPLAEQVVYGIVANLKAGPLGLEVKTGTAGGDRTSAKSKDFWDPSFYYPNCSRSGHSDIHKGFQELLEAVGKRDLVPESFLSLWQCLIRFRNKALHRVVWEKDAVKQFLDEFGETEWFESVTSQRDGKTTYLRCLIRRQFVRDAFQEIENLAHAFCDDPQKELSS